jgi:hypothetical protein
METDTNSLIHYLCLLLIVGSIAEIYTRARGLGAAVQKDRKGLVIPYKAKLGGPIVLGIISVILAIVTSKWAGFSVQPW